MKPREVLNLAINLIIGPYQILKIAHSIPSQRKHEKDLLELNERYKYFRGRKVITEEEQRQIRERALSYKF